VVNDYLLLVVQIVGLRIVQSGHCTGCGNVKLILRAFVNVPNPPKQTQRERERERERESTEHTLLK
jgi:hypothetical protein